jgi:hypothetical protein
MSRPNSVTEIVLDVLRNWEWNHSPREINQGMCGEFAHRVQQSFDKACMTGCEIDGHDVLHDKWGNHQWVYDPVTDKHYDAECPEGVDDWKQLPFYNR